MLPFRIRPRETVVAIGKSLASIDEDRLLNAWRRICSLPSSDKTLVHDILNVVFSMLLRRTVCLHCSTVCKRWYATAQSYCKLFRQDTTVSLSLGENEVRYEFIPTSIHERTSDQLRSNVARLQQTFAGRYRLKDRGTRFAVCFATDTRQPGSDLVSIANCVNSLNGTRVTTVEVVSEDVTFPVHHAICNLSSLHTLSMVLDLWIANVDGLSSLKVRTIALTIDETEPYLADRDLPAIRGHGWCETLRIECDLISINYDPVLVKLDTDEQWPNVRTLRMKNTYMCNYDERSATSIDRWWKELSLNLPDGTWRREYVIAIAPKHKRVSSNNPYTLRALDICVDRRGGGEYHTRPCELPRGIQQFTASLMGSTASTAHAVADVIRAAVSCRSLTSLDICVDNTMVVTEFGIRIGHILRHCTCLWTFRLHSYRMVDRRKWMNADRLPSHGNLHVLELCLGLHVRDSIRFIHKFPRLEKLDCRVRFENDTPDENARVAALTL